MLSQLKDLNHKIRFLLAFFHLLAASCRSSELLDFQIRGSRLWLPQLDANAHKLDRRRSGHADRELFLSKGLKIRLL
jgi:hypothetical protein